MFGWLYKGVSRSLLESLDSEKGEEIVQQVVLKALQDEEVQKQVVLFGDALFDRYKQKTMGVLGTFQQKVNKIVPPQNAGGFDLSSLMDSKGQLNVGNILANLVMGNLGKKGSPPQSREELGKIP